jgi:5-methylcytosine-specific restriction endonuclease McrA
MSAQVIVLNSDYTFLNFIDYRKAFTLLAKEKIEVIKYSENVIKSFKSSFKIPSVVRLINFVNILYRRKVSFTKDNVYIRDNYTCGYCLEKLNKRTITLDHIIPKSKGGKDSWENCVSACKKCNEHKGDKFLQDTDMHLHLKPRQPNMLDFIIMKLKNTGQYEIIKEFIFS